jgi:hypothetical protein
MTDIHVDQNKPNIKIDRLSICFKEPNPANVKGTINALLPDKIHKAIPGAKFGPSQRYAMRAVIPFPHFDGETDGHPICFEAGPLQPGHPSYRLDYNPSKLSPKGNDEVKVYVESLVDPTVLEFFHNGYVTRVDVAVDLHGNTLEDVIVRSVKKRKHGVYSDAHGVPETVYLGGHHSKRAVAYTKTDNETGEMFLRFECRLKPKCLGVQVATLPNPLSGTKLIPVAALHELNLGFPTQLLADSIRVRGINRALKPLDKKSHAAVVKAIKESQSLLPDGDALWSLWPQALIAVGLGDELGASVPANIKFKTIPKAAPLLPASAA